MRLIIGLLWAVVGAIATRYYGDLRKDKEDMKLNPLAIYVAFSYMMAGYNLCQFME